MLQPGSVNNIAVAPARLSDERSVDGSYCRLTTA
jgi:hypothetical protein